MSSSETVIRSLKTQVEQLEKQVAGLRAVRSQRNRHLAAMVVEGLAEYALAAQQGDQQAVGNMRTFHAVIQGAAAASSNIVLPDSAQPKVES